LRVDAGTFAPHRLVGGQRLLVSDNSCECEDDGATEP
jgi:hypothetical protein